MEYFLITLNQIFIFIIYAAIGIIAVKTKVLNRDGLNAISRFITKISLPLMVFTNTINGVTREQILQGWLVMVLSVVMYLLTYLVAVGLSKFFPLKGNELKVYRACTMFGNVGFMGIPLITALFPEKGMLYIVLFTVMDQLVLWTVGVKLTTPIEAEKGLSVAQSLKKMINPAMVGILLAVAIVFIDVQLPELLNTALVKTGAVTTPMAMIYLGGLFCFTDIGTYIKKPEFYCSIVVKMCIFPVLFYYLLCLIPGIGKDVAMTMSVLSALPTMTTIAMLAQIQKSAGEYAAGSIFVTTLFSIVTLPLICLFMR